MVIEWQSLGMFFPWHTCCSLSLQGDQGEKSRADEQLMLESKNRGSVRTGGLCISKITRRED